MASSSTKSMGNCVQTCTICHEKAKEIRQKDGDDQGARLAIGPSLEEEVDIKEGGFQVKMVLSKEELSWLLLQLEDKGGKSLKDALEEIENWRNNKANCKSWKPSLESIMEAPELVQSV